MSSTDKDVQKALTHIEYLSESIGGRGSCTEAELQAGEYVARQMRAMSLKDIRTDAFEAVPSTYWGFALSLICGRYYAECTTVINSKPTGKRSRLLGTFSCNVCWQRNSRTAGNRCCWIVPR